MSYLPPKLQAQIQPFRLNQKVISFHVDLAMVGQNEKGLTGTTEKLAPRVGQENHS